MQTHLSAQFVSTEAGREAEAILRRCVHCGFCNATCPTYEVLGEENDGPRGRIYLIKALLERGEGAAAARRHLDRCLGCRGCERTCPSGVAYTRLLDLARERLEGRRPLGQRWLRRGLRGLLPCPRPFAAAVRLARPFKGLLPRPWREVLPPAPGPLAPWPPLRHRRRVILAAGCVQSVAAPAIDRALARVLDAVGISVLRAGGGCCGAVDQHLGAPAAAARHARRNLDAWGPLLESGQAEAVVSSASACALQFKEYGRLLAADPACASRARRLSEKVRDPAELIAGAPPPRPPAAPRRVVFHAPCTLQHGQGLGGVVERILRDWGFEPLPVAGDHLCCGAAGTYALLQPRLAGRLRAGRLAALEAPGPECIASANIGCLLHLRARARVPVRHWLELLADCLPGE